LREANTEGSYTIDIDGRGGEFTVVVPTPPTPAPVGALPVQPPTNWWLIGGIVAGCVVIAAGLLVYFLVWRKRGESPPSQV
jgi:H+/gluconate symporter-like permease